MGKPGYESISDDVEVEMPEGAAAAASHLHPQPEPQSQTPSQSKRLGELGLVTSLFLLFFLGASRFSGNSTTLPPPKPAAALGSVLTKGGKPFKVVAQTLLPSSLWGSVQKPHPTGAFFTNLVVGNGDGPVALHPYGVKCLETGVQVSYGPTRRAVTPTAIADPFASDMQISSVEAFVSRSLERFDNASVTMGFMTATPAGGKYRALLVKGSPFVTVAFENTTPVISSPLMKITAVDAKIRENSPGGVQYIVTLGNYQRWLVYCSEPVLIWRDNVLTSSVPVRAGVVRIAILPQQPNYESAFTTLMTHVGRFPTGVQTTLSYSAPAAAGGEKSATLQFNFQTQGTGPLLMYALPHQTKMLTGLQSQLLESDESKAAQSALQPIYSIKGKLTAVVGESWSLHLALPVVGWNYAVTEKLSTEQLDEIAISLMQDLRDDNGVPSSAPDPYTQGKLLGRMARLALISEWLGIPDARAQALGILENSISPWIMGTNSDALVYDRVYGGLITSNGLLDPMSDFGSSLYNDHHFHWGYYIYAAAVVARLDPAFFDANKERFDVFVRDVCNPSDSDTDFPLARHKDLWDGHSWASGLFQQANGKGQESSSEAVNAYYGCYLYSVATSNKELQSFSHFLLASEVQAAQTYWHIPPNGDVYDAVFSQNRMVGVVGALDVSASTWFGSALEYVHGINIMPLTPATALLLDQPFVAAQYPLLASLLPDESLAISPPHQCDAHSDCVALGLTAGNCCPSPEGVVLACCGDAGGQMQDEWKTFIYAAQAVVEREGARSRILTPGLGFGLGGSRTNSLFWAATRPVPAVHIDTTPHQIDYAGSVKQECSANSACDVAGLVGDCCPTVATRNTPASNLGCCPRVS